MTDRKTFARLVGAALAVGLVASSAVAASQPPSSPTSGGANEPQKVNLARHFDGWFVSFERGDPESAYICGEYTVAGRWSVAGCGTGSGFLYPPERAETDLAHFRAQYAIPLPVQGPAQVELSPGAGVVELQRGRDRSGLRFAPGRGPDVREASGPEAAVELELGSAADSGPFRSLHASWISGVAWIPDAPAVVPSTSEWIPFTTLTVNGRF